MSNCYTLIGISLNGLCLIDSHLHLPSSITCIELDYIIIIIIIIKC